MKTTFLSLGAFAPIALGLPTDNHAVNAKTSLTQLFHNNLNASDIDNHVGAILLDPMTEPEASDACEGIGEMVLSRCEIDEYADDFKHMFSYLSYSHRESFERYITQDGVMSVVPGTDTFTFSPDFVPGVKHPVLCTQTSTENETSPEQHMRVNSGGNSYIGYRDQKSFRFLGIPYADQPERFEYSHLYSGKSQTIQATEYGSQCPQASGGSEDCLFLNIQTPYLPMDGEKQDLKPVMFWIHGGGFTGGSGADPLTDGGNLASREDIVVVEINYRLGTLGFFAVPGTDIDGNFGIADQIVALEVSSSD